VEINLEREKSLITYMKVHLTL